MSKEKILNRTLKCPCHKERMLFENIGGMRIDRGGYYKAKCEKSNKHFKVKK